MSSVNEDNTNASQPKESPSDSSASNLNAEDLDETLILIDKDINISDKKNENYEIENSIDTPWKNAKDDKEKRVCVCIVGDMNEVTKLIEDESFSFRYNGFEKDIVGMCAVPISHALEYIKSKQSSQITSTKRNNKSRSRSGKKMI